MIFISAGHNSKSHNIKQDPGAVNKDGVKEGDLTIEFRDLVCKELDELKLKYIKDSDEESLVMYLNRIKTGEGSLVIEYHFDSADSPHATGATGIIEELANENDKHFASEITNSVVSTLSIRNRGVIFESQSHRGKLGLMREEGIICLCELCFISNPSDLSLYHAHKHELAKKHALIIQKYENLIP